MDAQGVQSPGAAAGGLMAHASEGDRVVLVTVFLLLLSVLLVALYGGESVEFAARERVPEDARASVGWGSDDAGMFR